MVVEPGLCRTRSETPKTGFLTTRLKLKIMPSNYDVGLSEYCQGDNLECLPISFSTSLLSIILKSEVQKATFDQFLEAFLIPLERLSKFVCLFDLMLLFDSMLYIHR